MHKPILRLTAVVSISLLANIAIPKPARSNPAAALAPAVCATGLGCVVVGTIIIGGVLYYVYVHRSTGQQYQIPAAAFELPPSAIVDPENPGEIWKPGEEVAVYDLKKCYEIARRHGKTVIGYKRLKDVSGGDYYVCHLR